MPGSGLATATAGGTVVAGGTVPKDPAPRPRSSTGGARRGWSAEQPANIDTAASAVAPSHNRPRNPNMSKSS